MKDIRVTSFTRAERVLVIEWTDDTGSCTSHFYRHSDGSWHPDPDTLARGKEFLQKLNEACIRYSRKKPAEKKCRKKKERIGVWFA